ncbi:MAG: V-type ATP synthase subunit D [Thermoproteota archaeon]|jgi:V/A-type H+-transporting ATPase subunit D|nr:V-type ATP synthase subunit D [Thermoproteota archaeon]
MSQGFGGRALPTKINLIRLRRSLAFARRVKKILEDKREVILHELEKLIDEISEESKKVWDSLFEAYDALYSAYMSMGPLNVNSLAITTPQKLAIEMKEENLMGVKVPRIKLVNLEKNPQYGFLDSSSALDKAVKKFQEILPMLISNAEKENAIYRLAEELKKTQRQVNALKYVIIPNYEKMIYNIGNALEEREREDFVRLKKIKAILERKTKHGGQD